VRIVLTSLWTTTVIAVVVLELTTLNPVKAGEPQNKRHVVEIRNLEFIPKELKAAPGDTITWINYDLVPHTVTADDESWDSGLIGAQGQWQTVVKGDMHATYLCRYHPYMTGRLQIIRRKSY